MKRSPTSSAAHWGRCARGSIMPNRRCRNCWKTEIDARCSEELCKAPNGAIANSQGRQPLDSDKSIRQPCKGGTCFVSPFQGFECSSLQCQGLAPLGINCRRSAAASIAAPRFQSTFHV